MIYLLYKETWWVKMKVNRNKILAIARIEGALSDINFENALLYFLNTYGYFQHNDVKDQTKFSEDKADGILLFHRFNPIFQNIYLSYNPKNKYKKLRIFIGDKEYKLRAFYKWCIENLI